MATNEIISVLAVVWGGDGVEAGLEAESIATNESVPVVHLSQSVPIRVSSAIGEDNTSERIALKISTMRIKLATFIGGVKSDTSVVNETNSLDVSRSLGPLQTGNSTRRNETSTVVGLGAVGYDLSLNISDFTVRVRGTPQAEVIRSVENQSLAVGIGTKSGRIALVETELRTTQDLEGVYLVWEVGKGVSEGREDGSSRTASNTLTLVERGRRGGGDYGCLSVGRCVGKGVDAGQSNG